MIKIRKNEKKIYPKEQQVYQLELFEKSFSHDFPNE
jgi:hypothetical protein